MTTSSKYGLSQGISSARVGDIAIGVYVFAAVALEDGSSAAKIARFILVASALIETTAKPVKGNLVIWWQLCFVGYAALSIFWAFSSDNAQQMALTLAINAMCIIALTYLIIDDAARVRLFLVCLMIAPTLLMIRIGAQHGLLAYVQSREAGNTNANIVGIVGAFGFGLASLNATRSVLLSPWIGRLFVLSNILVVAFSASRKAITMVALIVILFSLLNNQNGALRRVLKVATAAILGLMGYWLIMNVAPLYTLIGHRMDTMLNSFRGTGEVDSSTTTRLSLIEKGLRWFEERPWFGHGGDNFRTLMATYYPHELALYAHNNFVEILVNFGIFGFVLFYWMYARIIITGIKHRRDLNPIQSMALSLMITLFVMEYGSIDYFNKILMAFVAVAWVAVCTNTLSENREGSSESEKFRRLHLQGHAGRTFTNKSTTPATFGVDL